MTAAAPPRYVVLPRRSTILMFGRESFNPTASVQVAQMGDIGMLDSLMGKGFYELLAAEGLRPFRDMGVRRVYVAIAPSHLRLMRRCLKGASIEQLGTCRINGKDIPWALITDLHADT